MSQSSHILYTEFDRENIASASKAETMGNCVGSTTSSSAEMVTMSKGQVEISSSRSFQRGFGPRSYGLLKHVTVRTSNQTVGTASIRTLCDASSSISTRAFDLTASMIEPSSPVLASPVASCPIAQSGPKRDPSYQMKQHKHKELGCMEFQYDSLDKALERSLTAHAAAPVLYIQAELPGDTDAGLEIFSHPLFVEASQSHFTTVFCKDENYFGGRRSASGKSPRTHVSFLDHSGNEIVPTLFADGLTKTSMAESMIEVLEIYQQDIPKYLLLVRDEERGRIERRGPVGLPVPCHHRAVFGIKDSALGEVEFAGLDGVISTRAGVLDQQRIVRVSYDASRLCFGALVRYALKHNIGRMIYYQSNDERVAALMEVGRVNESSLVVKFRGSIQPDYDPKPALHRSPLRFVPMTELQATRANRFVHLGKFNEAMHILSPRQGLIFMQARGKAAHNAFKEVVDVPIFPAWMTLCDTTENDTSVSEPETVDPIQTG